MYKVITASELNLKASTVRKKFGSIKEVMEFINDDTKVGYHGVDREVHTWNVDKFIQEHKTRLNTGLQENKLFKSLLNDKYEIQVVFTKHTDTDDPYYIVFLEANDGGM